MLAAVLVFFAIFQVFFRYEYLHSGALVYRIDRISQNVCLVAPRDNCSTRALGISALEQSADACIAALNSDLKATDTNPFLSLSNSESEPACKAYNDLRAGQAGAGR